MSSYRLDMDGGSSVGGGKLSTGKKSCVRLLLLSVAVAAAGIGLGVIIGYFSRSCHFCLGKDVPSKLIEDATPGITERILELMDADSISEFHRRYTLYPHLAGTEGEDRLATEVYNTWLDQGLDYVTTDTYDVLLSYPNHSDPNYVFLLDETGDTVYLTQKVEKILSPDQDHADVVPPFNAYSPSGDVKSRLVYVNYGRIDDFLHLTNVMGINVTGSIVIARYGKIYRGDKVYIAGSFGAVGVILYSDPADVFVDTSVPVYPDSWWLPGTGVQRGSVFTGFGDPLTPIYPSIDSAYRIKESEASLPPIPVMPIGYEDAYHFLSILGGPTVPSEWQGTLNFTYHVGPGFDDTHANWTVRLRVATYNERRNTTNVIGYITGSVEPDRYVVLGNHRDAWLFGAVDPTSGTAAMMEVSRVLASIVRNEGWRPRRTIVFCSWGAEEYGLVGSTEWVEHYVKSLADRAVVYINVDLTCIGKNAVRTRGVPLVYDFIYDVARRIPSANDHKKSVFQESTEVFPDEKNSSQHRILLPGAASDYGSFITFAGIPVIDVIYNHNLPISVYPLYHSVYETRTLVTKHMDPEFKYSLAVGQFWAEAARYMSDSLILPLNVVSYATGLRRHVDELNVEFGTKMRLNGVTLDALYAKCDEFNKTAIHFAERRHSLNRKNPAETRMYNDQLMGLERKFIDPEGLPPNRPMQKHLLYAQSAFDVYAGASFPGLVDLMWQIDDATGDDKLRRWEDVKRHLAAIIYTIESAIASLRPPNQFI